MIKKKTTDIFEFKTVLNKKDLILHISIGLGYICIVLLIIFLGVAIASWRPADVVNILIELVVAIKLFSGTKKNLIPLLLKHDLK